MIMDNICLIIDMDGFEFGGKFHCRELGYMPTTGDQKASSVRFRIGNVRLTSVDYKMAAWCFYIVYGLPLRAMKNEKTIAKNTLPAVMLDLYEEFKTDSKPLVSYKGGHYEKDLLASLGIPSINLETYGCPKYEKISDKVIRDFGFHYKGCDDYHCPQSEVATFYDWMQ